MFNEQIYRQFTVPTLKTRFNVSPMGVLLHTLQDYRPVPPRICSDKLAIPKSEMVKLEKLKGVSKLLV